MDGAKPGSPLLRGRIGGFGRPDHLKHGPWVVAIIGVKRRGVSGGVAGIVVHELCERKELGPVVLMVVAVDS